MTRSFSIQYDATPNSKSQTQTNPACVTPTRQLRDVTPRAMARRKTRIGERASAAIIGDTFCASAIRGKPNAETVNNVFEELICTQVLY